jgi:hypothetical protein
MSDERSDGRSGGDALRRLQAPDDLSLRFNPLGLGGRLPPEAAAEFQAAAIAQAVLHPEVPEGIRDLFERVRLLHLYGVLEYEFFTAAIDQVSFVLEAALKQCFLAHYAETGITLVRGDEVRQRPLESFKKAQRLAEKAWLLRGRDGTDHEIPRSMSALLAWARREGLLPGRRTRRIDRFLVKARHRAAHPLGYQLQMPPDSASHIRDVAEFINRLWGHDTPGGSVFPAGVTRQPRIAALSRTGEHSMTFPNFDVVRSSSDEAADFEFALFRAVDQEELVDWGWGGESGLRFAFTEGFETTHYPCDCLYRGTLGGLITLLDSGAIDETPDQPSYLDRVFAIREDVGGELDRPRSEAQFLSSRSVAGRWHLIVADSPWDARGHVQHHSDTRLYADGTCPQCYVQVRELVTVAEHPDADPIHQDGEPHAGDALVDAPR